MIAGGYETGAVLLICNSGTDRHMSYMAATSRYDSMQYRRCGRSGLQLPAISLGLWHNFGGVDSFENMRAMLRRAFDLGLRISILRTITDRRRARQRRTSAGFCRQISQLTATN